MHGGTIKFNKSNQLVIFDNSRPILDTLSWEMATDSTLIVNVPDRTSQHNEVIIFEIKSVSDIELILSGYGNAGFTYLSLLKE